MITVSLGNLLPLTALVRPVLEVPEENGVLGHARGRLPSAEVPEAAQGRSRDG